MLKKIISFLLIISIIIIPIFSNAQDNTEQAEENVIIQKKETISIQTKAKVIETGETYEENTQDILERKQKVKLEILEGDYQGKEFDATYILSYDIDNKIQAYELNVRKYCTCWT